MSQQATDSIASRNPDLSYRLTYTERMRQKEEHYAEVRKWVYSRTLTGKLHGALKVTIAAVLRGQQGVLTLRKGGEVGQSK